MKTRCISKTGLKKSKLLSYSIVLIALFGLSACNENYWVIEDRPSRAYLALTWSQDEPDYIDAGTGAIPEVFYWNDYYRIQPGIYSLYYDGIFNDGYDYIEYAWEVEYEIYTNQDFYNDDYYFTIDMNPYGPYVYEEYKSTPVSKFKVLEQSESRIVILKEQKAFSLKISYTKTSKKER